MTESTEQFITRPFHRAACYDWAIRDVLGSNPGLTARLSRVRAIATVVDRTIDVVERHRGGVV